MKIYSVIPVSHTTPNVYQSEDDSRIASEDEDQVATIEGEKHIVESVLVHQQRRKGFRNRTLIKEDPHHDAVQQPTKHFVDSNGTVTEARLKYIQ